MEQTLSSPRGVLDGTTMAKHLQRDLDKLQRDLLTLAGEVEEAISRSIRSLQERDADLAREVIAGDSKIDEEENKVSNT